VGFLTSEAQSSAVYVSTHNLDVFRTAMRLYGWVEGENLVIDVRYADGQTDRLPDLAGQLQRLPADVTVGFGNPVALTTRSETPTTPVVIFALSEPVPIGVATSLSCPGGNITGMSAFTAGLVTSKVVKLIHSTTPRLVHPAVLTNGGPSPLLATQGAALSQLQGAVSSLAIQTQVLDVRSTSDFEPAFVQAAA
jgi:putative ABC transport system substrate-binding protein